MRDRSLNTRDLLRLAEIPGRITLSNVGSLQPALEEIRYKRVSLEQIIEAAIFLLAPAGAVFIRAFSPSRPKGSKETTT